MNLGAVRLPDMSIIATFAAASVSADSDVSGIASDLARLVRANALKAEHSALSEAERSAEDSGDDKALSAAMDARDAWEASTERERVALFGRSGWWS
jgi:hypothetical protein